MRGEGSDRHGGEERGRKQIVITEAGISAERGKEKDALVVILPNPTQYISLGNVLSLALRFYSSSHLPILGCRRGGVPRFQRHHLLCALSARPGCLSARRRPLPALTGSTNDDCSTSSTATSDRDGVCQASGPPAERPEHFQFLSFTNHQSKPPHARTPACPDEVASGRDGWATMCGLRLTRSRLSG